MSFLNQLLNDRVLSLDEDELDAAATLWQYRRVLPEIKEYFEYYIEHDFAYQIKSSGRGVGCAFSADNVSAELLDEIAEAAAQAYVFHVAVDEPSPMEMRRDIAKVVWEPQPETSERYADAICRELGIKED